MLSRASLPPAAPSTANGGEHPSAQNAAAPTAATRTATARATATTRLAALLAAFALLAPGLAALDSWMAAPASAGVTDEQLSNGGVLRESRTQRVAPGLDLTTFSRLEEPGWNEGSVLTADLRESTLSMDVRDSGTVTGRAPLQDVMRQGEGGERAVAAVNGTFFDINHSDAPIYTSVSTEGLRSGTSEPRSSFTVADGHAAIQQLSASGTATLADGTELQLDGMNTPNLPAESIGVYTAAWGDYTLDRPVGGPDALSPKIARATVVDGVVTEVSGIVETAGDPDIADGAQVLLGREAGADAVAALDVGDTVEIEVGPSADVDLGIAGSHQILVDGEVADMGDDPLATAVHPRTAVGISRDGSQLFVLVLDGRTAESRGMTLPELAELLRDMGAHNALNLDGGGSSAMAARVAGDQGEKIWNSPSDGEVREVPNALVFYSDAPAQQVSDVQLRTSLDGEDAVLPGMHRTVEGTGLGANLDPVLVDGTYAADGPVEVGEATADGTARIKGVEAGQGTVTYTAGGMEDSVQLRVLGAPIALQASARSLSLPDADSTGTLTVSGVDADGQRAQVEAGDLEVEATDGFTVTDDGLGTWTVTATGEADTGSVTFSHGDLSTTVALTHGTEQVDVFDFADPSAFSADVARATGSFDSTEGPENEDGSTDPAIGLTYDFTTSSATRGYYLVADEPVEVEGSTLAFTMDVRGDGTGAWPRLQVTDAQGTVTNLDGDHLEFEGWQQVRFTVPEGLPQPLTVERVRIMETRPEAQYNGDIAVANLQAITTPQAETAPEQRIHDAALLGNGSVADRPQRIAVMSDAQFVAADPDSDAVAGARRTLREIKEEQPDLLVINGDFVDEASEADFALAKQILDEEWGTDIPYIYVPGNHEVMGGEIANFEAAFGPVTTSRDLGRTKVITLNTASGSLRGGGIDQIAELERQLEEVKGSDVLTGVTVFFHHPPTDPLPSKLSQLSDQREARAVEDLLADFRRESGKSAAMINGHVGVFHGSAVEGVTYLINGNSGKNPSGTVETGGFTGWTMLGISPGAGLVGQNPTTQDRVDWLAAETRPWVDELSLNATEELLVGAVGTASADFTQDGRTVPVAWPVTAQWGGEGVKVDTGTAGELTERDLTDPSAVVRVNPSTGEITGLRPGQATLTVTVNGRSAEQVVTVTGPGQGPSDPEDGDEDPGTPGDGENPGDEPGDDNPGDDNPGEGDPGEEPGTPGDDTGTPGDEQGDEGRAPGDQPGDDEQGDNEQGDGSSSPGQGSGSGTGQTGRDDSAQPGSGDHGSTPLARTGTEALPWLLAGTLLMLAGAAAVVVSRKRAANSAVR